MESESKSLLTLAQAAADYLHAVTEARRVGRYSAWVEAEQKGNALRRLCDEVLTEEKRLF